MQILIPICALVNIVCWIIVLVKIFQAGNIGIGIVGIICGIVAFIYGWTKADELQIKNVMIIWTVSIIAQIALTAAFGNTMIRVH